MIKGLSFDEWGICRTMVSQLCVNLCVLRDIFAVKFQQQKVNLVYYIRTKAYSLSQNCLWILFIYLLFRWSNNMGTNLKHQLHHQENIISFSSANNQQNDNIGGRNERQQQQIPAMASSTTSHKSRRELDAQGEALHSAVSSSCQQTSDSSGGSSAALLKILKDYYKASLTNKVQRGAAINELHTTAPSAPSSLLTSFPTLQSSLKLSLEAFPFATNTNTTTNTAASYLTNVPKKNKLRCCFNITAAAATINAKSKLKATHDQIKNDVASDSLKLHHIQSSTSTSRAATSFLSTSSTIKRSLCLYAVSSIIIVLLYLTTPIVAYDTVHPMYVSCLFSFSLY